MVSLIARRGNDVEQTLKLDLPLLLPEIPDARDPCVERVRERLSVVRGILQAHVEPRDGQRVLCVHFDPELLALSDVQRLAEQAGTAVRARYRHETLDITGMDCADCAFSIEHILGREPGVLHVRVNYAAEKMSIECDGDKTSHAVIVRRIRELGYTVVEERRRSWFARHREQILPVASGVFLAVGYFGEWAGMPPAAAIVCYVLAYLCGGYDVARHGLSAALRGRFDIEFLMVAAAIGAAALGNWAEGGLLLFLFSLGHALEHYAMDQARHAVKSLGAIAPRVARVRRDGQEIEVKVADLHLGDDVLVRPAERVPADGDVVEGSSAVDQSPITGESVPVEKRPGDSVFAGCLNGDGALVIRLTKRASDSTLARVMRMVEEAQTRRSPAQHFVERFTRIFVPVALVSVLATIVLPPLLGWLSWREAFLRAMAVLVAASPCALALATPAAVLAAIARAARAGVLIKGGIHLENLGAINAIAFDKTGTLTVGRPEVVAVMALVPGEDAELLRLAGAVESRSSHPLAQAIARHAGPSLPTATDVQSITGRGMRAMVEGQTVRVGNRRLFEEDGLPLPGELDATVRELEAAGRTAVIVHAGERFRGVLGLADRPRPEARTTCERLRRIGVKALVVLTGDNERVASAVATEVGIPAEDVRAGLLPEGKLLAIQALLREHGTVAMVGDGVNDAPALALSTVGIAMGAGGTDVALETADVALMADDLTRLPFAVALSRKARGIVRQNLVVSLGVVALLMPLSLFGVAGIAWAILLHEGSTLVVVANALRLLRYREPA
jgi:Cd2+/Zn2+-exporting ATPase